MKKKSIGVLLIIMICLLGGCGKNNGDSKALVINLNKYISIKATGYDTIGDVEYVFDTDKFKDDYGNKLKVKSQNKADLAAAGVVEGKSTIDLFLETCVSGTLDKTYDVSNGDEVKFTWNCKDDVALEYYSVKLKYSDKTFTVDTLEELEEFDPFANVRLGSSGYAEHGPSIYAKIPDGEEYKYLEYTVEADANTKNGDKIKVNVEIYKNKKDFIEKFHKKLSCESKDYLIYGIKEIPNSLDELSEDVVEVMKKNDRSIFDMRCRVDWRNKEVLEEFNYMGVVYYYLKPGIESVRMLSYLVSIYKVVFSINGNRYSYYTFFKHCDIELVNNKFSIPSAEKGFMGQYIYPVNNSSKYNGMMTFSLTEITDIIELYSKEDYIAITNINE